MKKKKCQQTPYCNYISNALTKFDTQLTEPNKTIFFFQHKDDV